MDTFDPFALGGRQDDDAELIAAWRRYQDLDREISALSGSSELVNERTDALGLEQKSLIEFINNTPPTTLAGCAAKLAYLADPNVGIEIGDRDDDAVSIRQVLQCIEGGAAGQADGAEALALFREWLAESRVLDAAGDVADDHPAYARRDQIELEIFALRGPVALAVKTFLFARVELSAWTPRRDDIRGDDMFNDNGEPDAGLASRAWTSMLRDAAELVPEIAERAAAILHPDAPLIDAETTVLWAEMVLRDPSERLGRRITIELDRRMALDRIARVPAKTARGEASRRGTPTRPSSPPARRHPEPRRGRLTAHRRAPVARPGLLLCHR